MEERWEGSMAVEVEQSRPTVGQRGSQSRRVACARGWVGACRAVHCCERKREQRGRREFRVEKVKRVTKNERVRVEKE